MVRVVWTRRIAWESNWNASPWRCIRGARGSRVGHINERRQYGGWFTSRPSGMKAQVLQIVRVDEAKAVQSLLDAHDVHPSDALE